MKMTVKTALVPVAALVVAAGAGTAYYLASGTGTQDARGDSLYAPAAKGQVAQAFVGDPNDPATWRLPIQAYMATEQQVRLVTSTRDELIDQCMSDAGYPAWKPAPDLPAVGGKTLTDWRYGVHDAELAAKRGYHPAEGEQAAYDQAMEDGAVDESGAPDDAVRACVAKVDGEVPSAQPADIVQQVSGEGYTKSLVDPSVTAVFAKWSACMKNKGYSYEKPMDASDDPRFNGPDGVTRLEIATAVADIACRNEHDVARTWFDAESEIQRAKIAEHLVEFNEAAKASQAAVAKAKSA